MSIDPSSRLHAFDCPLCRRPVTAMGSLAGRRVSCPHCGGQFAAPSPAGAWPVVPPVEGGGTPFQFQCLRCQSILEGHPAQSGQRGKCPSCGAVFTIPSVDPRTGRAMNAADPGDDGQDPTPVHAYAAAGEQAPRIVRLDDGRATIECPRCHHHSRIKANGCEACGHPFTIDGALRPAVVASGGGSVATLSLGFGVAGLLMAMFGWGALLAAAAIVCGMIDVRSRTARRERPVWTGHALAGVICGAIGLVVGLLVLLG